MKYSEYLTKHLRLRQKEITMLKCGRIICSLVRFPKIQLTPNGLSAQQIKLHTKDNLSQVSKKKKTYLPTHVEIHTDGLKTESVVLLEHIRTIDKARLYERIGKIGKDDMGKVDHALIVSFGIKYMEDLL